LARALQLVNINFFRCKKNIKSIKNVLSALSLAVNVDPRALDLAAMSDPRDLGLEPMPDPSALD